MRYYLCILAVVFASAARLPRELEHPHFPHFRTVYHGHGATSYQSVQIQNHDEISVPSNYEIGKPEELELTDYHEHHHSVPIVPIVEPHDHVVIPSAAPHEDHEIQHVEYEVHQPHQYYEHYDNLNYEHDHENDYEYH